MRRDRAGALRWGRAIAGAVLGATASSVTLVVTVASAPPATAYPSASVSFEGHGWGFGEGMGQWGALGYALGGDPYASILEHFYGGTTLQVLAGSQEATQVRVALTENNGNSVIVTSGSSFSVAGTSISVGAGHAVFFAPTGSTWHAYTGPGCGGPWTAAATVSNPTAVPSTNPGLGDPNTAEEALQLCQIGGNLTVRGSIEATYNSDGSPRTVNILPLEQYVAGVVPNESPAGWGTIGTVGPQGQPWGFQELEAQAVAARSYVMAGLGSYGGYADTCDLECQTYRGTLNESAITDLAATDTAGQVMEFGNGSVAATAYSSSTGGYTAPSVFPAVPDTGDTICVPQACNPNHTWTASVPVSTIDAAWPQLGTLVSLNINSRNGYGEWGGRVTSMTLVGTAGNVTVNGVQFATVVGLKSDWFTTNATLGEPAVGMSATPNREGYWVAGSDGAIAAFGNASFDGSAASLSLVQPVVGMAAIPDDGGYWLVASDGGLFSYGDASFYGSMGGHPLNKPVVGMAATPDGHGYWEVASDGGIFSFGDASFYGSMGGHPLNKPVVGMAAAPDGHGYWEVASDGGIFSFGDASFYGSTGDLALVAPVVGMASAGGGGGYWLVAADGGIFSFGDANFYGSAAG